jgi:uncharacterized membrane protein YgcG
MGQRTVRVVVGQGDLEHAGSLRRVLERDDVDVVGDATNASQLARVLTDEQPDIVVLDDVIGIAAVELAAEIAPQARLVVVWPAAVMPIAGAIRVDPSEVATTLAATVALAAGLRGLRAVDRPEWIERVKKDPATLREMLAARGALPTRPSVTELQRRGHRLHPSPTAAKRAGRSDGAAAAAVVPIGLAASQRDDPADAPAAADAAVDVPPALLSSAWNRRLGIIALGGAAAAGALMIAIALGPHASNIVSAEPFPVTIQPAGGPPFALGDGGGTQTGGNGGTTSGGGTTTAAGSGGGGSTTTGGSSTTTGGQSPHGSLGGLGGGAGSGSGGSGSGGSGSGGSAPSGGSSDGPKPNSSHLPGAHGTGKPGTPGWRNPSPGGSGNHNPHGGPPGHSSSHPGHGHDGQGGGTGDGSTHGNGRGNGNGNGGGNGGGTGASSGTNHPATHGNTPGHSQAGTHGNSAGHSQAGTHGNPHANGHAGLDHGRAAAHRHKR